MYETKLLLKDDVLFEQKYNSKLGKHESVKFKGSLFSVLEETVTLEDVTVFSLAKFLSKEKDAINIFRFIYRNCFIPEFVEYIVKKKDFIEPKFSFLGLQFSAEISEYKGTRDFYMSTFPSLEGYTDEDDYPTNSKYENPTVQHGEFKGKYLWGLTLSELDSLIYCPIKLDREVMLYGRESGTNSKESLGNTNFTLGQVIQGVFYELSYHGAPEESKKKTKKIKNSLDSMMKELKEGKL